MYIHVRRCASAGALRLMLLCSLLSLLWSDLALCVRADMHVSAICACAVPCVSDAVQVHGEGRAAATMAAARGMGVPKQQHQRRNFCPLSSCKDAGRACRFRRLTMTGVRAVRETEDCETCHRRAVDEELQPHSSHESGSCHMLDIRSDAASSGN